jgi:hypothetical protein
MYGDFYDFLLRTIEPDLLVAIDMFNMHTVSIILGRPSSARFQGMTPQGVLLKVFFCAR